MAEFSVFKPLQGIAPGDSWLWSNFLKNYKIIWNPDFPEVTRYDRSFARIQDRQGLY